MSEQSDLKEKAVTLHRGRPITRGGMLARGGGAMGPGLVWLLAFLILPSLALVALGFATRGADGQIVWEFTADNYKRLAGFGGETWTSDYARILVRSVWMALLTTAFSVALGYPLAFFVAARPARSRFMWVALLVIPIFTNLVIRTYAWALLLGRQAPPAQIARALGLLPENGALYPGLFATQIGMISAFLPFAALPLFNSVERLDVSLIEAARDLYASRWGVFRHAIFPQTSPGLATACVLTFIPAMGVFVIPDLLDGSRSMLIGGLIQQQFGESRDMPFGAAVSFALMGLTLAALLLTPRARSRA